MSKIERSIYITKIIVEYWHHIRILVCCHELVFVLNSFRPPRCRLRLRTPATCSRRLHKLLVVDVASDQKIVAKTSRKTQLSFQCLVLEVGSGTKFQLLPLFNIVGPFLGLTRNLGARHARNMMPALLLNFQNLKSFAGMECLNTF